MKTISVLIPCYNEIDNVGPMACAVTHEFEEHLSNYEYEIIFIDNHSTDGTRDKLRVLCADDKHIKAILNAKNFGQFNSPYYGLCQTKGDCTILLCCDFQDPVSMLPRFVEEWEAGYQIVCGIKATSKENRIVRGFRTLYYRLIRKMSDVEQIEHFTGFGLYDRAFVQLLHELDDPTPFLRGIVAELGSKRKDIIYEQEKRRAGKTHNNFYTLYDAAMLSFTSYTKIGMRLATIIGFACAAVSLLAAFVYLVLKLCFWDMFPAGSIPVLLAVLVFGSLLLFFVGLLGEYVMNINTRVMNRPLVVEDERLNWE
ncbi:glycosyltransferase family 2 protein [Gordonibacter massiliensis (ex Traore et al. 2017)]|uniref:glycosyltransferase family 2 protein n=1 Tax=Gordonibacter massiliensis (ex Traore et al. 2017) TaxID=1841863 RepID=UPI001C8CE87B|nr:glycosyltransferase family 2 protein [Gordonibacter massiliensis (ex Traore et al. 2017)]